MASAAFDSEESSEEEEEEEAALPLKSPRAIAAAAAAAAATGPVPADADLLSRRTREETRVPYLWADVQLEAAFTAGGARSAATWEKAQAAVTAVIVVAQMAQHADKIAFWSDVKAKMEAAWAGGVGAVTSFSFE